MRRLRIRTFTLFCLIFILLLPWIFYVTAHFLENQTFSFAIERPYSETMQRHLTETIHLIESNTREWIDPDWQSQLLTKLRTANMEATIISAADLEIFTSNPKLGSTRSRTEQFSIIEDGHLFGKVILYMPKSLKSNMVQVVSIVAGILLAFIIVTMIMRRILMKPLEKMSAAARQIAAGDLDVQLPISRITEITEVRDGFEVMVNGLQKSYQKQVELEDERRFVIAAVAHDLRTPLFALRGYLDGLEQGIARSPEKMAKYVAVCKEKSAQLGRLVEELFTFTKLEYSESKLNAENVDLTSIIQKSIESLSPLAQQKQIAFLHYNVTNNCIVNGDAHLLERAFNNLVDNAIRHTPFSGEISFQYDLDDNKAMIMIRDTGPGFSSEELERVFEPLYRGEVSRNRATGGSGLGLTIAQRIFRQHGGDLVASNHAEGGAVLIGWIPNPM